MSRRRDIGVAIDRDWATIRRVTGGITTGFAAIKAARKIAWNPIARAFHQINEWKLIAKITHGIDVRGDRAGRIIARKAISHHEQHEISGGQGAARHCQIYCVCDTTHVHVSLLSELLDMTAQPSCVFPLYLYPKIGACPPELQKLGWIIWHRPTIKIRDIEFTRCGLRFGQGGRH